MLKTTAVVVRNVENEMHQAIKIPRARLGTYPSGYPMERVALDVVGPLHKTNCGNRFSLVINDCFTK